MAAKQGQTRDDVLAMSLARGVSIRASARQAGVSPRTAHRRLADRAFVERVEQFRRATLDECIGILTSSNVAAARTLRKLLTDQTAGVRLSAAKAILDSSLRFRDHLEVELRLAALESQNLERQ
jgi:hypothetical protein